MKLKCKVLNVKIYLYDYDEEAPMTDTQIQEVVDNIKCECCVGDYCIDDIEVAEEDITINC